MTTTRAPYGIGPDGFRLPDRTRVGRVRLRVADLGRSLDFYGRVLGLRVVDRDRTSAALGAAGAQAPLVVLDAVPGLQPAPRRGAHGLYHFALLLPQREALGAFVAHLAAAGVPFASADHLVSEALYLSDPDGLGIEVYSDRPRRDWQHARGEVAMATEPLDLRSLVASAGGRAWPGAPEGTVLGHVHLHVGDLDEARRFYQAALGLDLTVWSYPGALFFAAGGYHHHLGTNTWARGGATTDAHARLADWELLVPGAAAEAAASLTAAGHQVGREGEAWTVADPWGTRLRLRDA